MWLVRTLSRLSGREKAALYYPDPVCDQSAECVIYMMDVLRVIGAFVLTAFSNSSKSCVSDSLARCNFCRLLQCHCIMLSKCYTTLALKIRNVCGPTLECLQLNQFFWQCVLSGTFFLSGTGKEASLREMLSSLGGNVQ